jgi:Cytochrome c554 and c-prime
MRCPGRIGVGLVLAAGFSAAAVGSGVGEGNGNGDGIGIGIGDGIGIRIGIGDGIGDPGECARCHPAEHAEWRASRHAAAWTDPVFQAEFARGRPAWCVGCHAPSVPDPIAVDDRDARTVRGVGCDGCHLRDGRMVSSGASPDSPHRTRVDPTFGSPDFCARCHEFRFPVLGPRGVLVRYTREPMQETVSQWRRSGMAGSVDCADCHATTPAGHAFPGSHRPDMVASALELTVCRGRRAVEARLANTGAAHHVPSGGVHRRMVLRAWRSTAPERMVEKVFGRRFRPLSRGGKQTISDTTIPPGRSGRLRLRPAALAGAPEDRAINFELRYVYAVDERAALPAHDVSRVILHRRVDPAALPRCR